MRGNNEITADFKPKPQVLQRSYGLFALILCYNEPKP